jgi:adenine-specific DNA-methyltransferase
MVLKTTKTKQSLGQYFTTNNELKEIVYKFISNNPTNILEPSIGQGDLVTFVTNKSPDVTFDMYEIDTKIKLLDNIKKENVIYGDFMNQKITKTYKTIIGNPPYVRTKKRNLYIDFIEKCYNLLEDNGELIFIIPSDFFKLTSASKLLNTMMTNGTFTHIYHPHNEKLFDGANIDVIVFRYNKNNSIIKKVLYNDKLKYIINSDGLITFTDKENTNNIMFKDYFDIYVGIVNGKEEVYKNASLGNIEVLNGENKVSKYIYIEKYPSDSEQINEYLLEHKKELLERGIKKFNEKNWFEWGAPRNIKTINKNLGKDCIYIYNLTRAGNALASSSGLASSPAARMTRVGDTHNLECPLRELDNTQSSSPDIIARMTRKSNISFVDKVQYFGGGLIMLLPKQDCNLNNIVAYLNSDAFKDNFIFSGRFKIGHRQISNFYIPKEYLHT